jgi:hypothetical protein
MEIRHTCGQGAMLGMMIRREAERGEKGKNRRGGENVVDA